MKKNLNFVIKIISPKIDINRFFEDENPEKIISELVKLSKPNNLKKLFLFFQKELFQMFI